MSDAYDGYNALGKKVTRALCNNHARRKFFHAAKFSVTNYQRTLAKKVMSLFDQAQKFETEINKGIIAKHDGELGWQWTQEDFDERKRLRNEKIASIMDDITTACNDIQKDKFVFKNGLLMRAANYYLNNETGLREFLNDGRIPFHNMRVEQTIKKFATRRRSALFNGSPAGAEADAINMTVIYSAEMNNLNVQPYLAHVFEKLRGKDAENDPELIRSLLPCSPEMQRLFGLPENPRKPKKECEFVQL